MNKKNKLISIVIPVFNNSSSLVRTLESLSRQTYPEIYYEVIVVDNGSNDNPRLIAEKFGVQYLEENDNLGSPYSARNRGIEASKGDIIALLDTTCTVVPEWLESGMKALQAGADLVGGDVVFDIDELSTHGEIYDSLINIRMKDSILQRNVAKTTNLFIKKSVFDYVGLFPERIRSGADVSWSTKAVKAGFNLSFSEDAKAIIQPRRLLPLIKKQFRVAMGQVAIWCEHGGFFGNFVKKGLLCFFPPNPGKFRKIIEQTEKEYIKHKIMRLYLIGYLLRVVNGTGLFVGLAKRVGRWL